jgi:uncharacterized membrane protein YozB (DUF420 family)
VNEPTLHPLLNASLNALSGILLAIGYFFIRRRNVPAHKRCMLSALAVSIVFLISYVIYHYEVGSTPFTGTGLVRRAYFFILITHVILAATIVPLAIVTVRRALREQFDAHRRIARWTFPIWMYVSVTGVVVYLMLYHWPD